VRNSAMRVSADRKPGRRPQQSRPAAAGQGAPGQGTGSRHNVTPEEGYRTALLSDSPDCGCSLCVDAKA
jgi:hypothetical protein